SAAPVRPKWPWWTFQKMRRLPFPLREKREYARNSADSQLAKSPVPHQLPAESCTRSYPKIDAGLLMICQWAGEPYHWSTTSIAASIRLRLPDMAATSMADFPVVAAISL